MLFPVRNQFSVFGGAGIAPVYPEHYTGACADISDYGGNGAEFCGSYRDNDNAGVFYYRIEF